MDSATRSRSSRRWLICVPILSLSLLSRGQNNSSDTFTSLKLREYCKLVGQDQSKLSNEEYGHRNICLFYVSGVLGGFQIGDSTTKICTRDQVSLGELGLVVSKYLDQYPERLHNAPEYLVIDALHAAFPCEASPPKK